jgi:hypothetical protein
VTTTEPNQGLRHALLHLGPDDRRQLRDAVHGWHLAAAADGHPLEDALAELVEVIDRADLGVTCAARALLDDLFELPPDPTTDPEVRTTSNLPTERTTMALLRTSAPDIDLSEPRRTLAELAVAVSWPETELARYATEHGHAVAEDDLGRPSVTVTTSAWLYRDLRDRPWTPPARPVAEQEVTFLPPVYDGRSGRWVAAVTRPGADAGHPEDGGPF